MTVHYWGENPRGLWTLVVTDNDRNTRKHHLEKVKQPDFEDASRVLMDESTGLSSSMQDSKHRKFTASSVASSKSNSPKSHTTVTDRFLMKTNDDSIGKTFVGDKLKKQVLKKRQKLKKKKMKKRKKYVINKHKFAEQEGKNVEFHYGSHEVRPSSKRKSQHNAVRKEKYKFKTKRKETKKFVIKEKPKSKNLMLRNRKYKEKETPPKAFSSATNFNHTKNFTRKIQNTFKLEIQRGSRVKLLKNKRQLPF